MDPVTLGTITTGLIVKAVDRAEDSALDAGAGVLRRLVRFVRDRVTREADTAASTALARVEDAPDSPSRVHELEMAIATLARRDEEFRFELERLLTEARDAGIDVDISQAAIGNKNVQATGIIGSEVHVSYSSLPPTRADRPTG
jgi:hypothetical protein